MLENSLFLIIISILKRNTNLYIKKIFVESSHQSSGGRFHFTLLGSLLNISCLPKNIVQPYEFFEKPSSQSNQAHRATEQSIWIAQGSLHKRIYRIFHALLKVYLQYLFLHEFITKINSNFLCILMLLF